ncbi:hypothetical protein PSTG_08887 [Puccinia striiformis f. sp. tritici PST-78]|uniref:MULE transposase domain-containing protein n=1 Tax=Puccinia striiformis f. sp. tritici PST-78 TaxID=1165861 RepID=A0A0L0VFT5_9BASI|nr:hypothetical protein PSTG_08887 [Puccinia striiformis f. sp. tritici PST-78]
MSKLPTPTNTGYTTPATTTGVTVTPEVWAQMQALFAMFPAPIVAVPPSAPPLASSVTSEAQSVAPPLARLVTSQAPLVPSTTQSVTSDARSAACEASSVASCGGDLVSNNNDPSDKDSDSQDSQDNHNKSQNGGANQADSQIGSVITDVIGDVKGFDYSTGEPLDPPPLAQFKSRSDLVMFAQMWAKHHAYAIATANSHAGKNVYLQCDRSGDYRGTVSNESGRQTASSKTRCPFKLRGSVSTSQKAVDKFWKLVTLEGEHNHDPSPSPSSHAAHRQLLPEQVIEIQKLSRSNLKPAQMLLQLKTSDNETYATNKTISNALQKNRLKELDGKSPVEALLSILKESNWAWDIKVDSSGSVQNLFFAHPGSIHLARINHHVALLDATYKTNRYKLPLLHVIGQAASNRSFSIAFCFLTYEDNENYLWAVENLKKHIWRPQRIPKVFITDRDTALQNALDEIFPESQANLCTWHINKNIATRCKTHFPADKLDPKEKKKLAKQSNGAPQDSKKKKSVNHWDHFMGLWNQVTYSKTPEIYEERLSILKDHLKTRPAVLDYLESSILPVKDLFVNSTGDLLSVFKSLALAVDLQINRVHESIGRDTVKTLVNVPKCFIPLLGYISTFAIKECITQFKRLADLDPTEPCSNTLTIGIGIPCPHKIGEILDEGDVLKPEHFHSQWHLKYNPEFTHSKEPELDLDDEIRNLSVALANESPNNLLNILTQIKQIALGSHVAVPIQAPKVKINPKGRPNDAKKNSRSTSTKRNPSQFEIVEAKLKKEQADKKRAENKKRALEAGPKKKSKRMKKNDSDIDDDTEIDTDNVKASDNDTDLEEDSEEDTNKGVGKSKELCGESKAFGCESKAIGEAKAFGGGESNAVFGELTEDVKLNLGMDVNDVFSSPQVSHYFSLQRDQRFPVDVQCVHLVFIQANNYNTQAPKNFKDFIRNFFDPPADGNCGFRCVAKALGYDDDDGWFTVRQEMLQEIDDYKDTYLKLQGGKDSINKIIKGLTVKSKQSKIDLSQWLDKLSHGQVLANIYIRPVVFLSLSDCNTYIPLRSGPDESDNPNPIYLLHVNGNHWVLANVEGVEGVHPIAHVISATRMLSRSAKHWKNHLLEGLALCKK